MVEILSLNWSAALTVNKHDVTLIERSEFTESSVLYPSLNCFEHSRDIIIVVPTGVLFVLSRCIIDLYADRETFRHIKY